MASYQPPHSLTLIHPGAIASGPLSTSLSHPAQHQGELDSISAPPQPTQTPAANEAEEDMGFSPTHTCAACKQTYPNNHALEKHAANERRQAPRKPHQAFLCTCGADFGRLGSLDRHITAQDGPKYYCDYCDDSKGFARLDKLVDHLRDTHKFGDKAIALARNQARVQSDGSGHPPFRDAATGTALPVSTSVAHDAAMEGISQTGYSAGPPAGPTGSLDGGLAEFNMSSAAEFQGFGAVDDYSRIAATEDFVGFDVSGLDLSGVDLADFDMDMDISGMGDPF